MKRKGGTGRRRREEGTSVKGGEWEKRERHRRRKIESGRREEKLEGTELEGERKMWRKKKRRRRWMRR